MMDNVHKSIMAEITVEVKELAKRHPPKTRADHLRLVRAAIETLPAVPKEYADGKVYSRPRGVEYK